MSSKNKIRFEESGSSKETELPSVSRLAYVQLRKRAAQAAITGIMTNFTGTMWILADDPDQGWQMAGILASICSHLEATLETQIKKLEIKFDEDAKVPKKTV